MKKLLSAILAAVLAVSLVGCGGGRDNNGGGQTNKESCKPCEKRTV